MNVAFTAHNLVAVGILASIFAIVARLLLKTPVGGWPVIGPALNLAAGG